IEAVVCCRIDGAAPRTTAYCNSDGRFAQIASWQYCSMAWPTLLDCRLRELRRNHCATAGQAQTRTYPGQRSSTGSCCRPVLKSVLTQLWCTCGTCGTFALAP